eukprot:PRCOL_00002143-RA
MGGPHTYTHRSYGARGHRGGPVNAVQSACAGVVIGIVLMLGSAAMLWWNEGASVERYETLEIARKEVLELEEGATPDPANRGRLVHVTATARGEILLDDAFGVAVPALRLRRDARMMQWVERKSQKRRKTSGGGTVTDTTYSYDKRFEDTLIRSDRFAHRGYNNPSSMPFATKLWDARVHLGGNDDESPTQDHFVLSRNLVGELSGFEPIALDASHATSDREEAQAAIAAARGTAERANAGGSDTALAATLGNEMALANSPAELAFVPKGYSVTESRLQSYRVGNAPKVGDVEVSFAGVPSGQVVSVLAKQDSRGKLSSWRPSASQSRNGGSEVAVVAIGKKSAAELIAGEVAANTVKTFALRGVGVLLMVIAFAVMTSPITALVSIVEVVPILGPMVSGIIGLGVCVASVVTGLSVSVSVIAVAWLAHRPVLATLGLATAGALLFFGAQKGRGKQKF